MKLSTLAVLLFGMFTASCEAKTETDTLEKEYQQALRLVTNWLPDGSRSKGMSMLRDLAEKGHAYAERRWAYEVLEYEHLYTNKVILKANAIMNKLYKVDDPLAIAMVASISLQDGNIKKADEEMLRAIALQDETGVIERIYGEWLLNGVFGQERRNEAVKYFKAAANNGDLAAEHHLAALQFQGKLNVKKNERQAIEVFYKLGKKGHRESVFDYAYYIFTRKHDLKTHKNAFHLLEKSFGSYDGANAALYGMVVHGRAVFGCILNAPLGVAWIDFSLDISKLSRKTDPKILHAKEVFMKSIDTNVLKKEYEEYKAMKQPPFYRGSFECK